MRYPRTNRESGFTLIELLVVIAIISLLVAILGVAVAGVRHRAQEEKTISLFKRLETGIQIYVTRYNSVPPVAPASTAPVDAAPPAVYDVIGQYYINSAYLHYYLGSFLYISSGFDGAGVPQIRKKVDAICEFQKSEVSTWDSLTPAAFAIGRYDVANIVAMGGAARGGVVLDAWRRAIAYLTLPIQPPPPAPPVPGNYTAALFPRPGIAFNKPGRNLTGSCVFWSRGLDGITALPPAGAPMTPPTPAIFNSPLDGDADGKVDNLDDISNVFMPYY